MSDTPFADNLLETDDAPKWGQYGHWYENMVKMERLLRRLRASANCYVSPETLREVDDFLEQK